MPDHLTVIQGGTVHDGHRLLGPSDVLIKNGRVVEITPAIRETAAGSRVIDATGSIVAPGFVDVHNMSRTAADIDGRDGVNLLAQGVTTVVVGNCGMSGVYPGIADVAGAIAQFGRARLPVNVGCLVGYSSLRPLIEHSDGTVATADLAAAVDAAFAAGAWGVSLGLMYARAGSQTPDELTALARRVGTNGGVLAIHLRDEGAGIEAAVREAVALSNHCTVVVLHLKVCGPQHWHAHERILTYVREAAASRPLFVTCYPYGSTNTALAAIPPKSVRTPDRDGVVTSPVTEDLVERDGLQTLALRGWHGVVLTANVAEDLKNRSIGELAAATRTRPYQVFLDVLARHPDARAIFQDVANEDDMRQTMRMALTVPASDGYVFDSAHHRAEHPRNYGAMTRALNWLTEAGLTIEEAIVRVSSRPAQIYNLSPRGRLVAGGPADLVLVDPGGLAAPASTAEPCRLARGVRMTMVGGEVCFEGGAAISHGQGRLLRSQWNANQ